MGSFRLKEGMFPAVSNSMTGKEGRDSTLDKIQEHLQVGAQTLGWANLGWNPTSHAY